MKKADSERLRGRRAWGELRGEVSLDFFGNFNDIEETTGNFITQLIYVRGGERDYRHLPKFNFLCLNFACLWLCIDSRLV